MTLTTHEIVLKASLLRPNPTRRSTHRFLSPSGVQRSRKADRPPDTWEFLLEVKGKDETPHYQRLSASESTTSSQKHKKKSITSHEKIFQSSCMRPVSASALRQSQFALARLG
ncbi:hypothetical protein JTE90_010832 [Oedothorax gibbosus]|uniref:Uncharacterized protein n=1 Tax=Oedothorax gibbosus TaxID=931172 RepID=A0AAV6V3J6_9ARAC|nr:hypothetical protein JTE90_010832 [Oedothorax gibbosus]